LKNELNKSTGMHLKKHKHALQIKQIKNPKITSGVLRNNFRFQG